MAFDYSISIHVPAWGTTQFDSLGVQYFRSFQSTFPRGERRKRDTVLKRDGDFNPRSRVGNDLSVKSGGEENSYFNPRSRVGNDRSGRTS